MPKGRSYASEHWKSFQSGCHSFVEDGFVHDKAFQFKAKHEGQNESFVVSEVLTEKTQGLSGAGQVKFSFMASQKASIFAHIGSATNIRLLFDSGVYTSMKLMHNFYGSVEINRSITSKICKVGWQIFKDKWSINNRLIFNFLRNNFAFDHKATFNWKNIYANYYAHLNFADKISLNKIGLLLNWQLPDINNSYYFIKFQTKDDLRTWESFFEQVSIGWNSQLNSTQKIGVEGRFNLTNFQFKHPHRSLDNIWIASEWRLNQTRVKAKVNKDLSHAISIVNKIGNYGEYTIGMQVSKVGTKNRFKFGTQIDINL